MASYIHHVPGRLRVKAAALVPLPATVRQQLEGLAGMRELVVNPKAGSLTVHFDPTLLSADDILYLLGKSGRLDAPRRLATAGRAAELGTLFGRAFVGAVVKGGVSGVAGSLGGSLVSALGAAALRGVVR